MKRYWLIALSAGLLFGCSASSNKPDPGIQERQDAAMRDPFSYGDKNNDVPTVTGQGEGGFDKQGFNRDLQRVFNP